MEQIARVDFIAEWDETATSLDQIQVAFDYYDSQVYDERVQFEGPSPLRGGFDVRQDMGYQPIPTVALQAPYEAGSPGADAQLALLDQEIRLRIVETYCT